MKNKKYEFLEHTADIKIKLQGETVKEIFIELRVNLDLTKLQG